MSACTRLWRSDALQNRDRPKNGGRYGPGSAKRHFAALRAASHPGHGATSRPAPPRRRPSELVEATAFAASASPGTLLGFPDGPNKPNYRGGKAVRLDLRDLPRRLRHRRDRDELRD